MSFTSRLSLVAALALGAAACFDRNIAAPPEVGGSNAGPINLPEPIQLQATFVAGHDYVVISWTLNGADFADRSALGFLVERASSPDGAWSELTFTRATSIGDNVTAQPRCYRVTARATPEASELDSAPSQPLCVAGGKVLY